MAVTILQETSGISGPGSTTLTCTLPSAPTVGNLLVLVMAGDKDTGALTLPGFTQQHVILGASVSLYMAYRVSDGTEQAIAPQWANPSAAGNTAWYAELEDTAVPDPYWQVSGSAFKLYEDTVVTDRSTNTTGLITHTGLAIAGWAVDDGGSVGNFGLRAYTNSYAEECASNTAEERGAVFVASRSVAAGVTTECTFSYFSFSGVTYDQIAGCVAVFSKLPAAKAVLTLTQSASVTLTVTQSTIHGAALTQSNPSGASVTQSNPAGATIGQSDITTLDVESS